jgi:hypothetical protein
MPAGLAVPRIGGNHHANGSDALLVYQADPGNNQPSLVSAVRGAKVDAAARSIGQRFRISPAAGVDCENPDVNSASDSNSSTWVVVYELVMQGCVLNLDPASFVTSVARVMVGDAVGVESALPDRPVFRGDFHAQWRSHSRD